MASPQAADTGDPIGAGLRVFYEVDLTTRTVQVLAIGVKKRNKLLIGGEEFELAPIDDDDLEGLLLARSPRFQALLDKSRASIQAGKGLSSRQFWDTVAQRQGER